MTGVSLWRADYPSDSCSVSLDDGALGVELLPGFNALIAVQFYGVRHGGEICIKLLDCVAVLLLRAHRACGVLELYFQYRDVFR